nr:hypothetical protein [Mycoplasmopsis bovis]
MILKELIYLGISPSWHNRIAFVQVKGSVLLEAMKHGAFKNVFSGSIMRTYSYNVSAKLISYKETKDDKFT